MSKSSRRAEARKQFVPAAEEFVHSAAERVGPLAEAAAERLGAVADLVSPLAHTAADRLAPLASQASDLVTPYAQQAAVVGTAYAQQAADLVSPYTDRLAPLATSARERGAQVAQEAVEKFGPRLDDALDLVGPAVEVARGRVNDELLPRLSEALSAAAGSAVVTEATKRGHATLAAARGELALPEPKKKGGWLKRLAIVGIVAAVVAVVARKFLGSKDSDWQAAKPSTPYAPVKPAEPVADVSPEPIPEVVPEPVADLAPEPVADEPVAEESVADEPQDAADDDPQEGLSAHEANLEANGESVPDQPAEGGDVVVETPLSEVETVTLPAVDAVVDPTEVTPEVVDGTLPEIERPRYEGEGVYVGTEPPEGFSIKGNERSMKYHLPESGGYTRTIAEVWFNSEEAAQAAGFVRAQR